MPEEPKGATQVPTSTNEVAVARLLPFYIPDVSPFASRAPVSPVLNQKLNQKIIFVS